jgi:hypothetical protein
VSDDDRNSEQPLRGSETAGTNAARRRLLKGGAAGAPLLWAVTTRHASAKSVECRGPSAFVSLRASGPDRPVQLCSGCRPEYWRHASNLQKWPAPYIAVNKMGPRGQILVAATRFHGTGCSGSYFGVKTMFEVLTMSHQSGYGALGGHICAALLNAQAGLTPPLSVAQVKELWNDYVVRGYYEPSAGIRWSAQDIVTYLLSTMPNGIGAAPLL